MKDSVISLGAAKRLAFVLGMLAVVWFLMFWGLR